MLVCCQEGLQVVQLLAMILEQPPVLYAFA